MRMCKQEKPEQRKSTAALLLSQDPASQPALPADESEGDEAQWESA